MHYRSEDNQHEPTKEANLSGFWFLVYSSYGHKFLATRPNCWRAGWQSRCHLHWPPTGLRAWYITIYINFYLDNSFWFSPYHSPVCCLCSRSRSNSACHNTQHWPPRAVNWKAKRSPSTCLPPRWIILFRKTSFSGFKKERFFSQKRRSAFLEIASRDFCAKNRYNVI